MSAATPKSGLALAAAALLLALTGCTERWFDPGSWRPSGANERNLQAMVANPNDLQGGVGASTDRGNGAARAVTRLYTDRRRPLMDTSIGHFSQQTAQDSGGGAGSQGGGASGAQ